MELRIHHILIVAAAFGVRVAAVNSDRLLSFPLNDKVVYEIPISQEAPTTIMFPSALTALDGANVGTSADQAAPVLLAYVPGRNFFSLRAGRESAQGALNVVWNGKTFALHLFASADPYRAVTFYLYEKAPRPELYSPGGDINHVLGLVEKAKNYNFLATKYRDDDLHLEHRKLAERAEYRDYRVTLGEVFRFDNEDLLIFMAEVENLGSSPLRYSPEKMAVRIGREIYYSALTDRQAPVPAHSRARLWFAITGDPHGHRANLSITNTFCPILPRAAISGFSAPGTLSQ